MDNQENLEKKLEVISAIDDTHIKTPKHIPAAACVQEANTLYKWAVEDKEALMAYGLAWELVEELPVRLEALAKAEARWNSQWLSRKEISGEWSSLSSLAYDLRDRLLADFRFAFRGHPGLLLMLKSSPKRKSYPVMIQDLNDLSVLGRANPQLLDAVRFDMSLLEKAAQTSMDMSSLLAQTTTARLRLGEDKKIRDQAYTHLKEAVDEIRRTGQHVFRRNKERFIGYVSSHLRQTKNRQTRKSKMKQMEQ